MTTQTGSLRQSQKARVISRRKHQILIGCIDLGHSKRVNRQRPEVFYRIWVQSCTESIRDPRISAFRRTASVFLGVPTGYYMKPCPCRFPDSRPIIISHHTCIFACQFQCDFCLETSTTSGHNTQIPDSMTKPNPPPWSVRKRRRSATANFRQKFSQAEASRLLWPPLRL